MPIAEVFDPRNRIPKNLIAIGFNDNVDNAYENVWPIGGRFPWPSTWDLGPSSNITIVSSSLNDTIGGAGAQMVRVTGLGGDGFERNEFVNMNGTTPVLIPGTFTYIDSFQVLVPGALRANLGTILVQYEGITVGIMPPGTNLSQGMFSTIPNQHEGFLYRSVLSSTGATDALLRIWSPQLQIWFEGNVTYMAADGGVPFSFQEGNNAGSRLGPGFRIETLVRKRTGGNIKVAGQQFVSIYHC